jgi:hypothetical protein
MQSKVQRFASDLKSLNIGTSKAIRCVFAVEQIWGFLKKWRLFSAIFQKMVMLLFERPTNNQNPAFFSRHSLTQ